MNDSTKKLARPSMDALNPPTEDATKTLAPTGTEEQRSTIDQKPFNATLTHGLARQLTEPEVVDDNQAPQPPALHLGDLAFNETLVAPQQTEQRLTSPFFKEKAQPPQPGQETLNLNHLRKDSDSELPLAQTILSKAPPSARAALDPFTNSDTLVSTFVNTEDTIPAVDHDISDTMVETFNQLPNDMLAQNLASISEASSATSLNQTARLTSLPSVHKSSGRPKLNFETRERYKKMGALGEGGMGDVMLVQDDDIDRRVAMKRLKRADSDSLLRFIDEIRTIGQLEHPNIIPIHDVGVDQDGSYFFIMKHIKGDTLEDIIEGLSAGKPEYHQRYSFDVRIQIFLNILQAVSFAHTQDIIHRDIKPANIMVGEHGEVTVMDWGLAKPLNRSEEELNKNVLDMADTLEQKLLAGPGDLNIQQRLRLTQQGELLGTPAYMSPEQAQGQVDLVDKRADTFALSVMFYELMTLTHYLEDKTSLITMLHGVIHDEATFAAFLDDKNQNRVPAEVAHYLKRGMLKDLDERFQDADEMIFYLQRILDGTFAVECPITFMKSNNNKINRALDNNPWPMIIMAAMIALVFTSSVAFSIYSLIT